MAKGTFFYSKTEENQLKQIKALHKGKERLQILADWAAKNNRKLPSVMNKISRIKVNAYSNNLVVGKTSDIVPYKGIIHVIIDRIVIKNGEMEIYYR